VVIVGGRKPRFFAERDPFLEVDEERTANQDRPAYKGEAKGSRFERNTVYQGGNMVAFERMAQVAGEEILYIGDHIFGDILRSKKDSRWRTCLVVEEVDPEIEGLVKWADEINALSKLDQRRHAMDDAISVHRALLSHLEVGVEKLSEEIQVKLRTSARVLRKEVDQAKRDLRAIDQKIEEHQLRLEKNFNPHWGRLLKEKNELSRFGAQVAQYADIYTSRVTNLLQYSPVHKFRAPRETMSHDIALMDRGAGSIQIATRHDLDELERSTMQTLDNTLEN